MIAVGRHSGHQNTVCLMLASSVLLLPMNQEVTSAVLPAKAPTKILQMKL